ncbi:MAG: hypothetical protein Phog2KO_49430 [Phototrophicaceae bacterium]
MVTRVGNNASLRDMLPIGPVNKSQYTEALELASNEAKEKKKRLIERPLPHKVP